MTQLEAYGEVIHTLRESQIRHTVTLFMWNDVHDLRDGGGSATCVEVGGKHYLLTAAHVIRNKDVEHIGVVFDRDRRENNKFVVAMRLTGGGKDDSLDIGLLELSPEGAAVIAQKKEFVGEDRMLGRVSGIGEDRLFTVNGSPEVWNKLSEPDRTFASGPMCYSTRSVPLFPAERNPDNDIALEYLLDENFSPQRPGNTTAPALPGMSGGGIWLNPEFVRGEFWNPRDAKLIGVQHTWWPAREFVLGTQVQHALALLADSSS